MSEDPKKWWLISDKDVQVIKKGLDPQATAPFSLAKRALHTLDSGLHETDAIPADWKEKPLEPEEDLDAQISLKFFDLEEKQAEISEIYRDIARLFMRRATRSG